MTAKQKANQARFKKVVAEAKKLRKKNPKLTQAQAVKQAWAMTYSKNDVSVAGYHKDTKSHNVNIKVVSGIKINRKPGKIGALPVDFTGSVLGLRFRVYNQFNLDGTVTLQVVENTPGGDLISNIDGRTGEVPTAAAKFWGKIDGSERKRLSASDEKKVKKTIQDFLQNLHKEVKQYNSGKDTRTKKGQRLNVKATPKVSKGPKDQIKDILRSDKKRLKYGYTIVPGKVMSGIKKISGIPHKAKYYIKTKKNGIEHIEYFDKMPQGYYKGMDRILYLTRFEDSGTVLTPIRYAKNDKEVKK
jgi:hypothetical protein